MFPSRGAMSTEHSLDLEPGAIVAGKYAVESRLGKGSMGVVYAARHEHLGNRVAIKVLAHSCLKSAELVERFTREAKLVAGMESEHVARVLDVGTLDDTRQPFIVMEYLEGRDFKQVLSELGPMPVQAVAAHVLEACDALAEAHANGVVHRDVKPANLFLANRKDGSAIVKVLDFGVSKPLSTGGGHTRLTQVGVALGSPPYMSPEQIAAPEAIDARSDIWSLGVVLYELTSGARPFVGANVDELMQAILTEEPPRLRKAAPHASQELETVVARCLEKKPSRRYANVAELALELSALAPRRLHAHVARIARRMGLVLPDAAMDELAVRGPIPSHPALESEEHATAELAPSAARRMPDTTSTATPFGASSVPSSITAGSSETTATAFTAQVSKHPFTLKQADTIRSPGGTLPLDGPPISVATPAIIPGDPTRGGVTLAGVRTAPRSWRVPVAWLAVGVVGVVGVATAAALLPRSTTSEATREPTTAETPRRAATDDASRAPEPVVSVEPTAPVPTVEASTTGATGTPSASSTPSAALPAPAGPAPHSSALAKPATRPTPPPRPTSSTWSWP